MPVVLDTCALIAFAEGEHMKGEASEAIRNAQIYRAAWVPSVTAMEVAQKVAAGKLELGGGASPRSWFGAILARSGFREFPTSVLVAIAACELPGSFHKDLADRLIVATARLLAAPVVTVDRRILAYGRLGHVETMDY